MKFWFFEIRRIRKEVPLTPEQKLHKGCALATEGWNALEANTRGFTRLRPWVDWDKREVNVVEYSASLRIVQENEPEPTPVKAPQKPRGLKLRNGMYTSEMQG